MASTRKLITPLCWTLGSAIAVSGCAAGRPLAVLRWPERSARTVTAHVDDHAPSAAVDAGNLNERFEWAADVATDDHPIQQVDYSDAEPPLSESAGYSLSLGGILFLAETRNPQLSEARERIQEAYARVDRAEALWLPSLRAGLNYNHHEGVIQDVAGQVFETNRSSFYGGLGANAVGAGSPAVPGLVAQFHLTDAIFEPRIAQHRAASRQFGALAVRNDTLRDAVLAYLELMRAMHRLGIAQEARDHSRTLTRITEGYAETGQGLRADHERALTDLALREEQLAVESERMRVASAQLAQILHCDPTIQILPEEPVSIPLALMDEHQPPSSLVALGLSRRPELCEQRHLVCAAVERIKREKYAPLVPSVLLGMSYGAMGGGFGSSIVNTGDRWDADAVAYWELRNLGAGDRAAQRESRSAAEQARLREVALLDRVAREVVEAQVRAQERGRRITAAEGAVSAATRSYQLNLQRIENAQGLPIETLQSIQALAVARTTYLDAVIDYNIAQFELCRATGWFTEPEPT